MLQEYYREGFLEAGCDEAGRGCLAGPVFAAAVILPAGFNHDWLRDSKKLSAKKRDYMRKLIEGSALAWAVASVDSATIDQVNILNASIMAMHEAVNRLQTRPELLLVDGNRFKPYPGIPHQCIIRGDATFRSIAAASILAKTHRDAYMTRLAVHYPQYGWDKNKGYPTWLHQKAIARSGQSEHHRKSFRIKEQLSLFSGGH
jgi:ribonuclease HII